MSPQEIRYPIGVQSFKALREDGYVYVDKTGYFPLLFQNKYYFLSRPRRFGKSLLLSTLEAYFRGEKDLFEGLAISKWETDWIEYPIIHIDFNNLNGSDINEITNGLRLNLERIAKEYNVPETFKENWTPDKYPLGVLFSELIRFLYQKTDKKVVILIDEYDKGIIDVLHEEKLLEKATSTLQPFFNVLKSSDTYIKFAFITGVSRFRNTTLFSGANNLSDISLEEEFASLLGISHNELIRYFRPSVLKISQKFNWDYEKTLECLQNRYDGYRFTGAEEYVYNPYSLLSALRYCRLDDYWVATGSSKSLAKFLKDSNLSLEELTSSWVSGNQIGSTYSKGNPLSLLFQTGYLTIDGFQGRSSYHLGIPNQEVQAALVELIIPEFVKSTSSGVVAEIRRELEETLYNGEIDKMMTILKGLLSNVPYHEIGIMALEKHMHLCLYIVFLMLGADAKCEISNAAGRLDMLVETPWRVYLFEFKLDKSAKEALEQIQEKGYAIPWEAKGRKVIKIGVEFSSSLRTISRWEFAE